MAAVASAGAFALLAPAAHAETDFQVNSLNDAAADGVCDDSVADGCTLRDAVALAGSINDNTTITFASNVTGTIRLTQGPIELDPMADDSMTIDGPGQGVLSISGDADDSGTHNAGDSGVIEADGGASSQVYLSDITLTAGDASEGAGVDTFNGNATTLDHVTISDGAATGGGGAIFNDTPMTVENSTISGNTAAGEGGGVYTEKPLLIENSSISGNTAAEGGGIAAGWKYNDLHVSGSTINGNSATDEGGGVYWDPGGFLEAPSPTQSTITGTTISGNQAPDGAGMWVEYIGGPSVTDPARIPSELKVDSSTISGNTGGAGSEGGGIAVPGAVYGIFALVDSTVAGNSADKAAGVSFDNGTSPLFGPSGTAEVDNSTVASNTATTAAGGGIYLGEYMSGGNEISPDVELSSTIVSGNTANGAAQDLDRADTSTAGGFDGGFDLIGVPGDAPLTESPAGSDLIGADPELGGLAENGGPTQTMLPAAASLVVDQGKAATGVTTDQRGDPRVVDQPTIANATGGDGTDIGAVELGAQGAQTPPSQNNLAPGPGPGVGGGAAKKCKKKKRKHHASAAKKRCGKHRKHRHGHK